MFEYNFGFFLKNKIQKINPKINFVGYQHGIFSRNLWWFEFIKKFNTKKFFPEKIIANNYYSFVDYKKILKKYVKYFNYFQPINNSFSVNFSKLSNNYLIVLGQHDHNNILKIFLNNNLKFFFFIKAHPRSPLIKYKNYKNLKKFNPRLKYKKILFSQTTTMYYNFLNKKKYRNLMLIGYDYKKNITFNFIKKNKFFIF